MTEIRVPDIKLYPNITKKYLIHILDAYLISFYEMKGYGLCHAAKIASSSYHIKDSYAQKRVLKAFMKLIENLMVENKKRLWFHDVMLTEHRIVFSGKKLAPHQFLWNSYDRDSRLTFLNALIEQFD